MNITDARVVHCVGIGGIGLSALARLLKAEGKTVSGSDRSGSVVTEGLTDAGIEVRIGQGEGNVPENCDLLIYSDAILEDNPERSVARERHIAQLSYFEALGAIANEYYLIAVAGAHGKTTTTAMIADVLEAAGLDPTVVVGSLRAKTQSNFRAGKSKYFVVEADEYRRHFHNFEPDILVVTNIDADHLDYYKDLQEIQSAFAELAKKIPEDGFVICNAKDPLLLPIVTGIDATVIDYTAHIDLNLKLKAPGMHNLLDAAAALAVASALGVEKETAKTALREFVGTWRRFQFLGNAPSGALVYDDYGHHPAEIKATLQGTRELFPDKRIIAVFHPHLYSRTKLLFDDFAHAFTDADEVILAPIFAAREVPDPEISSERLAEAIGKTGIPAQALDSFESIEAYLRAHANENDLVLTIGAGDIYRVAERLVSKATP